MKGASKITQELFVRGLGHLCLQHAELLLQCCSSDTCEGEMW